MSYLSSDRYFDKMLNDHLDGEPGEEDFCDALKKDEILVSKFVTQLKEFVAKSFESGILRDADIFAKEDFEKPLNDLLEAMEYKLERTTLEDTKFHKTDDDFEPDYYERD